MQRTVIYDSAGLLTGYNIYQRIAEGCATFRPASAADSATATPANARPEELFGSLSTLGETLAVQPQSTAQRFSDAPLYHICAAVLLVGYCMALVAHRSNIAALLRAISGRFQSDKTLNERNRSFSAMLSSLAMLGCTMTAMLTLKLLDAFPAVPESLPRELLDWAVPLAMLLLAATEGFGGLLLRAAGGLTRSKGFTGSLLRMRTAILAVGAVVLLPLFLPLTLSHWPGAAWMLVALVAAWTLTLMQKTFQLFVIQKISILHWFLYLCTVEIFPLSAVALAALRNN
ncbi:MAG: DUF4271 domain-containing protein [Rikenellaceae bacterium]|jgi:hypothetical protein|nr:DUF4271 domain-containing protein [Rikenellaceae bacterium]